jgi:hypothetical protein
MVAKRPVGFHRSNAPFAAADLHPVDHFPAGGWTQGLPVPGYGPGCRVNGICPCGPSTQQLALGPRRSRSHRYSLCITLPKPPGIGAETKVPRDDSNMCIVAQNAGWLKQDSCLPSHFLQCSYISLGGADDICGRLAAGIPPGQGGPVVSAPRTTRTGRISSCSAAMRHFLS